MVCLKFWLNGSCVEEKVFCSEISLDEFMQDHFNYEIYDSYIQWQLDPTDHLWEWSSTNGYIKFRVIEVMQRED